MAIELITGRYGTAHIGSEDVRAYQAYTAGSGRYILHGGGATIQSANDVHLNPAEILIDGAHVRITGMGEDVTLENGASSYSRVDIVALHYLMTGSGDEAVESVTLEVVKGTPSELTPSDPEMPASGSILDNVTETYVPYVRVLIQGLTPQTPEALLPDYINPADISGDGEQVNPSVLVNLGSSNADTIFSTEPRPGVYGTLPVLKGGTGATNAVKARSNLGLDEVKIGYLRGGRGTISDLSCNTLYNRAPGTYLVSSSATNGPESGQYGNLLVSYSAGNRVVALLSYDNGDVFAAFGETSSGNLNWRRIDNGAYGKLLWSGSWSRGEVTIPGVNQYRVLAASVANSDHRLVGVNVGWGTVSLFANDCWIDDSATGMAVSACRLMRTGSSETLEYSAGGRINLGNDYSYGYGVIHEVWGVA